MAKFRKKPIVVEATQYLEDQPHPPGVFIDSRPEREGQANFGRSYVITAHGEWAYLTYGDWVITEPDGQSHYPCKPDVFEEFYEPVEEPEFDRNFEMTRPE